jgi:hypothetical protein
MTELNDERARDLTLALSGIDALMKTFFPHIEFFVVMSNKDATIYSGNGCPMCAVEIIADWAEANDIQHDAEREKQNNSTVN